VKALVSGRSRPKLLGEFGTIPSLTLDLLTCDDIRNFVGDSLEKSFNFQNRFLDGRDKLIIEKVVEKSNGIFLWAALAVKEIYNMVQNGWNPDEILEQLERIGAEIPGRRQSVISQGRLALRSPRRGSTLEIGPGSEPKRSEKLKPEAVPKPEAEAGASEEPSPETAPEPGSEGNEEQRPETVLEPRAEGSERRPEVIIESGAEASEESSLETAPEPGSEGNEEQRPENDQEPEFRSFYDEKWEKISESDQPRAYRILQTVQAVWNIGKDWTGLADLEIPLTLLDLLLAESWEPDEVRDVDIAPGDELQQLELHIQCRELAESFKDRWPGFIEIQPQSAGQPTSKFKYSRIRYCSASVKEFLEGFFNTIDTRAIPLKAPGKEPFSPYMALLKSAVLQLKIFDPNSDLEPLKTLWASVTLALLSAKQIETMTTKSVSNVYLDLLDVLDKTMQQHHVSLQMSKGKYLKKHFKSRQGGLQTNDKGSDAKRRAAMHWSNFNPKFSHELKWEDSFESLAVHFGLTKYLDRRLGQLERVNALKSKKGRPLLYYAVAPSPLVRYDLINLAVIELLVDRGAKLGQRFEKKTCLEHALQWQYEIYVTNHNLSATEAQEVAEIRLQILEFLVSRSADIPIKVQTLGKDRKRLSPKEIVASALKGWISKTSEIAFENLVKSLTKDEEGENFDLFRALRKSIT
jgi:hypothetical protein